MDCPRAKSDMTPCLLRDGELAELDCGLCVGCELTPPLSQLLAEARLDGVRDGLRRYAWWKDGTEYVGGTTLRQAIVAAEVN